MLNNVLLINKEADKRCPIRKELSLIQSEVGIFIDFIVLQHESELLVNEKNIVVDYLKKMNIEPYIIKIMILASYRLFNRLSIACC